MKKIVFLCGCLEPGCDGVGDYTRMLSVQLSTMGYQVSIVALNDYYCTEESINTVEYNIENESFRALRLPSAWHSEKRFKRAKEWIQEFDPEWISLQFVPFAFHPRGLAKGLAKSLRNLGKGRKWNIMFHELWVGFTRISSLKHRITGAFQKKLIVNIAKLLNPEVVTTTNRLYQLLLLKNRVTAKVLPLFSNIPVAPINNIFLQELFKNVELDMKDIRKFRVAGVFGNVYAEAELENAVECHRQTAEVNHKTPLVLGFGKTSNEGLKRFKNLETKFKKDVYFFHFGEQTAENASNLMQLLDVALSCTPAQHISKSGVFAAMKLHNVEVIIPEGNIIPEYDAEIKTYNKAFINRPPANWGVDYIAEEFLSLLDTTNKMTTDDKY